MNNLHKTILAILLLMAATGCEKEKYVKPMSDAAYETVDRICGDYRLMYIDWTGEPVDLDGDGVAQESLLEECFAGKHLGRNVYDNTVTCTVEPVLSYKTTTYLQVPFFYGFYNPDAEYLYPCYYSLDTVLGELQVLEDGSLDIQISDYQGYSVSLDMLGDEDPIQDIAITWDSDGDLLVAGTTTFRDERTGKPVSGRATHRYHCVSTKEKKKR